MTGAGVGTKQQPPKPVVSQKPVSPPKHSGTLIDKKVQEWKDNFLIKGRVAAASM